jgi:hypothetical protein
MATVIAIVNYDRTVITIVNYDPKTFIEQATGLLEQKKGYLTWPCVHQALPP